MSGITMVFFILLVIPSISVIYFSGEQMASSLCKMSPLDRAQVMRDIDAVLNNKTIEIAQQNQYAQL
jgi:hypothetical protein